MTAPHSGDSPRPVVAGGVPQPDWTARAAAIEVPYGLLIDGALVPGGSDEVQLSPRDGRLLGPVAFASGDEVDRSVVSARAAFESGVWSRRPTRERGRVLIAFADVVAAHAEELAVLISLEMGKPVREALRVELPAVVGCLRWFGEAIDKVFGEIPDVDSDTLALVTREPAGVVAAVVPWNFPLTMTAWKIAPALAAGNSVILKPAEVTSLSAVRLGCLALDAGLPPGVLNVVPGAGAVVGEALGRHPGVDVLAFTGSPEVGRKFLAYSAASNGKRVWPELGGKTASLVLPDADLSVAVDASAAGCFYNQGQMCTASSRLLVHSSQLAAATQLAVAAAERFQPGDPLQMSAPIGAMVSARHLERVSGFVERADRDGLEILTGDYAPVSPVPGGAYLRPVVIGGAHPDDEVAQQEVFGPVLTVLPFDSVDQAVAIANGTAYGLAASLWTRDLGAAHRLARRLRAGTVWINCFEEGNMTVPFGGVGASGYGRDKSLHSLDKYTDLKTTWVALP